jgi:predicted NAD/FAD-binding protein
VKIAIIGSGGAGMTAAWLLDGRHDVTLFERGPILGGHAHTTAVERDGRVIYADDGFGWFSDVLYPRFMRLLESLGVPTRIVPMSMSFTQMAQGRTLALPPMGLTQLARAVAKPAALRDLLRLDRAIRMAAPLVYQQDRSVTWREFLRRHRFPEAFCREILTPLVAGCWGAPYHRVEEFSAYTLMKYLVFHRPNGLRRYRWHVLRDGAASYIQAVARTLTTCTVRRATGVTRLEPGPSGWLLHDSRGDRRLFDHVLVTTGARDARSFLGDSPRLKTVRQVLDSFEYYTVRVATHSDTTFMPAQRADWRVGNVAWDGTRAALTLWSDAEGGSAVFTSYVQERQPRECHNFSTFHLPLMTTQHHQAQKRLDAIQGHANLHFAGDWTRDIGCHEDAVVSALEACQRIDPEIPRIGLLEAPRHYPIEKALPASSPSSYPIQSPGGIHV